MVVIPESTSEGGMDSDRAEQGAGAAQPASGCKARPKAAWGLRSRVPKREMGSRALAGTPAASQWCEINSSGLGDAVSMNHLL